MPYTVMGIVVRHLPGSPPSASTVIKLPDYLIRQKAGDPDMVENWEQLLIKDRAQEHKNEFCKKFIEFKSASWSVHYVNIGDFGGQPHGFDELE